MFLPHNPLLWMRLTHMVNLSNINQCSFTLIQCCSKTESKPWAGHIHSIGLTNKMCFHFHFTLLASSIEWVYKGSKVGSELQIFVHLKYLFRKTFFHSLHWIIIICTLNVLCELINGKITLPWPTLVMWGAKWSMIWGALMPLTLVTWMCL